MRVFKINAVYDRYVNGKKNDKVDENYFIKTSQEQDAKDALNLCEEHINKKACLTDAPGSIDKNPGKVEVKNLTFFSAEQIAETDN